MGGPYTGRPRGFLERGRGLEGKDVDNLANLSGGEGGSLWGARMGEGGNEGGQKGTGEA